jgi:serine/threonine protein kinase/Tfp pilus assembly protein PilF
MSSRWTCPRGHLWESTPTEATAPLTPPPCPFCANPADDVPTRLAPSAADPWATRLEETPAPAGLPPRRPDRASAPRPLVPGYDILDKLGRGGMGVVYKARQLGLDRLVALKMIVSGCHAGPEELARFRTEAAAVARVQHPNIVQIFEVGEHGGNPYFSLEFCDGGSLDKKLRGTPVPPAAAARLVETLTRAVQAAHEQRVIHRDLKPSNILLRRKSDIATPTSQLRNPKPDIESGSNSDFGVEIADFEPKVTDFGLAKKLDEAGHTASDAVMGTPSYMAPEQARGQVKELGPAADVYSLGAILYECLTGRPPFKAASWSETLQQVIEDEPVPPRQLQSKTPRDLETICLKCLQKDPRKRYATAAALAEDLRRFQAAEPLLARPIRPVEKAAKWVRRRPVIATLLAAVVVLTTTVAVGATVAAVVINDARTLAEKEGRDNRLLADQKAAALAQEEQAKHDAEAEAAKANQVVDFLIGTFQTSDPLGLNGLSFYIPKSTGESLTAKEILERGAAKCEKEFANQPEVRAKILDAIGNVYRSLGEYDKAEPLLKEALAVRNERLGEDHLDVAASLHNLGWLYHERGDYDRARDHYERAMAIRQKRLPDDHPLVLESRLNLAWLHGEMGEGKRAVQEFREIVALRSRGPNGDETREAAIAQMGLAATLIEEEEFLEALPLAQKAVQTFLKLEGDKNLGLAVGDFQTAMVQREVFHNYGVAETKFRAALQRLRASPLGPDHLYNILILHELAVTLQLRDPKHPELADSQYRECVQKVRAKVGMGHPRVVILVANFSSLLVREGKAQEADDLHKEHLAALTERFGGRHPFVARSLTAYGQFLRETGRRPQAEEQLRTALEIHRSQKQPPNRYLVQCLEELGLCCFEQNKLPEAETLLREAIGYLTEDHLMPEVELAYLQENLARVLLRQKKYDGVEDLLAASVRVYRKQPGEVRRALLDGLQAQGEYYRATNRPAAARAALLEMRSLAKQPGDLYAAARGLALCVPLIGAGQSQLSEEEAAERDQCAAEALETLRQAKKKGYADVKRLKGDAALEALRGRRDFEDLVNEFESKAEQE